MYFYFLGTLMSNANLRGNVCCSKIQPMCEISDVCVHLLNDHGHYIVVLNDGFCSWLFALAFSQQRLP